MGPHRLHKLFEPDAIAVIAANPDTSRAGRRVFADLAESGFAGAVVPIDPTHAEIAGRATVPDLTALEHEIDIAVIATPAATVPDILRRCGEAGNGGRSCCPPASARRARGRRDEEALADAARRAGVRFLDPSCLGLAATRLS